MWRRMDSMRRHRLPAAPLSAALLLAACGGGAGGGLLDPPDNAAPAPQPASYTKLAHATSALTVPATSAVAVHVPGTGGRNVALYGFGAASSQITVEPDGDFRLRTAPANHPVQSYDSLAGSGTLRVEGRMSDDAFVRYRTENGVLDDGDGFIEQGLSSIQRHAPIEAARTLDYAEFAAWTFETRDRDPATGALVGPNYFALGAMAGGVRTRADDLPTGRQTYQGRTAGGLAHASGKYDLFGDAAVSADFGTGAIAVTLSGLTAVPDPVLHPGGATTAFGDITATGLLDAASATFAGTAAAGPSALAPAGLQGGMTGAFFGPAAAEAAGSWTLGGDGIAAVGAFGARR